MTVLSGPNDVNYLAAPVAGIGFVLTSMVDTGLFNYTKPRLTLIQAGYYVVSLTVAGAIIGAFG